MRGVGFVAPEDDDGTSAPSRVMPSPQMKGGLCRPTQERPRFTENVGSGSRYGLDALASNFRSQKPSYKRRRENEERADVQNAPAAPRPPPQTEREVVVKRDSEEEERERDRAFERSFYGGDEGGMVASTDETEYYDVAPSTTARVGAAAAPNDRERGGQRTSARRAQSLEDGRRWEEGQMVGAGVARARERTHAELNRDESNLTVALITNRDVTAPFLRAGGSSVQSLLGSGRGVGTAPGLVLPVRDQTSDMARIAREGSRLVKSTREKKEREKAVRDRTSASGTQLGQILQLAPKSEAEDDGAAAARGGLTAVKREDRASVMKKRAELPIAQCRGELMRTIAENQVVVVVGETGSGKTTQLTQYLREEGYCRHGSVVGCTQPRRVAAMSVAQRVSEELGCELGGLVGYSIRFEDRTTPGVTEIKYMTDGILLRESLRDPLLERYGAVVMDEAHERSLPTDILFGLLKRVVSQRSDLRLIVTSATMDQTKFSLFFGGAPVFMIPGRTFPVEDLWLRSAPQDYVDAAVQKVLEIHVSGAPGDILVFMTGQEDIEVTCQVLAERLTKTVTGPLADALVILPMYSQLPADLQSRIFEPAGPGMRKCVVSTNVAETSLTVEGIRHVVDSGLSKIKVYNPKIGMDALQVFPESQQNSVQRRGRAGRTAPGRCYHLFTRRAFDEELLQVSVPEIQRTNLSNTVLLLKSLGSEVSEGFEFMDPPPRENLESSLAHLWVLGALDDSGELTELGRRMVDFPIDPALGKMLITGAEGGFGAELVTVVSMLSVPTVFYRPKERAEESDAARERFFVPESDHLTLLNVYRQWCSHGRSAHWSAANFLHQRALHKVREIRDQLADLVEAQFGAGSARDRTSSGGQDDDDVGALDWDFVRKVVSSGYFLNAARLKGLAEYVNMRTGAPCHLHPTSALYGLGVTAEYVVYHELVLTSKEFMQCVTAVDPAWLAEQAPMIYTLHDLSSRSLL